MGYRHEVALVFLHLSGVKIENVLRRWQSHDSSNICRLPSLVSKHESEGDTELKQNAKKAHSEPPPVPRTTFLQIARTFYVPTLDIYSEISAVAGRLPFASMTSRGSTVSAVARTCFEPVFLLWPATNPRATVSVRESPLHRLYPTSVST